MLLFSALLAINDSMSKNDFIHLAIEWNQGRPYQLKSEQNKDKL